MALFFVDECVSELRTCHPGYFQCSSGHCISERFKCDGNADCLDFTDESSCRECAVFFIYFNSGNAPENKTAVDYIVAPSRVQKGCASVTVPTGMESREYLGLGNS